MSPARATLVALEQRVACPQCSSLDVLAGRMVGINDENVMGDWTGAFECSDCPFHTSHFSDFVTANNLGLSPIPEPPRRDPQPGATLVRKLSGATALIGVAVLAWILWNYFGNRA